MGIGFPRKNLLINIRVEKILVTPIDFTLQGRFGLQVFIEGNHQGMADEVENRIPVIFVIKGVIRFQDRCLAKITLEGYKEIGGQIIEIRIIGTVKHSPSCSGKIECRSFIDGKDIIQAQVLDVVGQIGVFEQIGIVALCEKGKPRKIFVHVKTQVRELIPFSEIILKKVARHILRK
jgi:hypothetical protein